MRATVEEDRPQPSAMLCTQDSWLLGGRVAHGGPRKPLLGAARARARRAGSTRSQGPAVP